MELRVETARGQSGNCISTGVLKPYENIQNLAHLEQFSSNHMVDPPVTKTWESKL